MVVIYDIIIIIDGGVSSEKNLFVIGSYGWIVNGT